MFDLSTNVAILFYTTNFHPILKMTVFVQIFDNVANSHKF